MTTREEAALIHTQNEQAFMKQRYSTVSLVALLLLAFLVAGYFAYHAFLTPEALKRREVAKWVDRIGVGVELPHGETPTLASVTNRSKLGEQEFFRDAENGDIILIYPRSGRAYLYRPATEKLIGMTMDIDIDMTR